MSRSFRVALVALLLCLPAAWAQSSGTKPAKSAPVGTYLGIIPAPVPEVLYDHVTALPRGRGVVVSQVLADSPAEKAKLAKNDILLSLDGSSLESCDHFARLIAGCKPDQTAKLEVLRAGKLQTLEVKLGNGPMLPFTVEDPRGTAKNTSPSKVSVSATSLADGTMSVTVEYYQEGTGKLRTVTCSGTPEQIDQQFNKLPSRVQDLARAAYQRIRAIEQQEPPSK